jgi:hypothetical protein
MALHFKGIVALSAGNYIEAYTHQSNLAKYVTLQNLQYNLDLYYNLSRDCIGDSMVSL